MAPNYLTPGKSKKKEGAEKDLTFSGWSKKGEVAKLTLDFSKTGEDFDLQLCQSWPDVKSLAHPFPILTEITMPGHSKSMKTPTYANFDEKCLRLSELTFHMQKIRR